MPAPLPDLPVVEALPAVEAALAGHGTCVLEAPPGAGKTTLVPLRLLDAPWLAGQGALMLEPRRLAARAAAARIAQLLGEQVGETAGYAVRFERRDGPRTRLLVVTEGLLVRRLQADPGLDGVGLVVFDEFHERSLDGDLGLALCLEVRAQLRPDLRLLVMSATLDGARVAALLGGAPVVRSAGRQFPVEVEHPGLDPALPLEERVARAVRLGLGRTGGGVLAFLPGGREIEQTWSILERGPPVGANVLPLYGELPRAAQDAATAPPVPGVRKVVLSTNIAETSLTIEGIACVVDGGLERRPRFSARTGMGRLVTVPVSRASAEQRRGRAGRLGPGLCLRLWGVEEDRALAPHRPPEIEEADLAPLALELAAWGVADPGRLAWLDPPPAGAFARARELLAELGALGEGADAGVTQHGRAMAGLPLHPRLAHMLLRGRDLGLGGTALSLAALLSTRDPERGRAGTDLAPRLRALADGTGDGWREVRRVRDQLARALGGRLPPPRPEEAGAALALAYPDRVARRRRGSEPGAYQLANGRGARLAPDDPLAGEPWLAVAEVGDGGSEARIRTAAALEEAAVERLFADRITESDELGLDPRSEAVVARRVTRLGRLALRERPDPSPDPARVAGALLDAVRARGLGVLPWTGPARQLQARVALLRRTGDPDAFPDLGDAALLADLDGWLLPHLVGRRRLAELGALDLAAILAGLLDHRQRRELDRLAPTHLVVPTGSRIPVDYAGDPPALAVRVQELFGSAETPAVAGGGVPLVLHLLSPAGRPVAVTRDLPGFWRGGYAAVRREMRGRYPRHPWPEDPAAAAPTRRAKPRGI